jgi:DNA-binding NarL/FixJ family response regulator
MSGSRRRPNHPGGKITPKAGAGKVRIFIVEDEIVIVRGLEDALARLGYRVCGFALSGAEALAAIAAQKPDLVLVDIHLQGAMDGIQLAQHILEAYAIPVIYITAYSNEEVLERAKPTNPFGYIVKPFRERQLKVDIELALARYRKERERQLFLAGCRSTNAELEQQLGVARSELKTATEKLRLQGMRLDQLRQEVHEVNTALLSLTSHITRTREEMEMGVAFAVRTRVLPILKQLQDDPGFQQYRIEFEMLSMHMNHLTAGLVKDAEFAGPLSTTELRIAALIKNDLSNNQIAAQLFLSPETVKTHRRNIRKKLGLQNSSINLATFLKAQWADAAMLH